MNGLCSNITVEKIETELWVQELIPVPHDEGIKTGDIFW